MVRRVWGILKPLSPRPDLVMGNGPRPPSRMALFQEGKEVDQHAEENHRAAIRRTTLVPPQIPLVYRPGATGGRGHHSGDLPEAFRGPGRWNGSQESARMDLPGGAQSDGQLAQGGDQASFRGGRRSSPVSEIQNRCQAQSRGSGSPEGTGCPPGVWGFPAEAAAAAVPAFTRRRAAIQRYRGFVGGEHATGRESDSGSVDAPGR